MIFWRLTTERWALDKICAGSRTYGGRWNPIGVAAMYAGTNVEICALEKFVHLSGTACPALKLVSIEVPDERALFAQPALNPLPKDWSTLPSSASAQEFGRKWLVAGKQLVLLIPSAIVPEATNVVINPLHPAFQNVRLKIVRDFAFDARMFK